VKRSGLIFPSGRLRQAAVFALAASSGSLIALLRLLMQDTLHGNAPFLLAWPGMILAAFLGGFWPTMIVTVVGAVVAEMVLTRNGIAPLRAGGLAVFGLFGVVFGVAGAARQRGLRRAAENERRLAEMRARLENVTRLNAMGEMAGVLAHELNQPLTAISAYVSAARRLLAGGTMQPHELSDILARVSEQSVRAGEVIARIRGYVTRGEISPSAQTLSAMFDEAAAVAMAGSDDTSLVLRAEFDPGLEKVLADRIQIQQVMLNLIRNAMEAMAGSRRRELRIGGALCGDMIEAFVADTGPGVSDEVAERLFQPFVTGKADGMGVGLSISRSIIESHGGLIWAERNADGGATFRFTLPLASSAAP
jgi:C4-dicarboxylate-specific signal transduction histidine kinase